MLLTKPYDPLEEEADRLITAAQSHSRKYVEYPCYSEEYLDKKMSRHEDTYEEPPEVECGSSGLLDEMAIDDLVQYAKTPNISPLEQLAWSLHCYGYTLREIADAIQSKGARKYTAAGILVMIRRVREQIEARVTRDPYAEWFIVYLETILQRHLY